ncbi:DUF167 family protein [Marichromatium gracile]|uniref:UPF0235 protein MARPU_16105 n=1 Tax=Marichromatium purpuratum 984 TaxID=765910 RepID=W0E834_MARPU|nr:MULTISPECIES: DUF167 family protein [Marichromatium]AHF05201.1 hypothetical protein MARPU_16105 [Marichromatium purpuratum 984]MCF1182502.1 DUF167 family protein [Marichromatium gracile]
MSWYRWNGEDLELSLRVQVRAPRDAFVGPDPGGEYYRVRIKAPPVDGKGNQALRRFVADAFGVAPSRVTLIGGEHARYKRLRIEAPQQLPLPVERP